MAVRLREIAADKIEEASFKIIENEFNYSRKKELSHAEFKIIQRVIHATGDFSFADTMRFSKSAIETGIKNIKEGKNILTDVTMAAAGVSKVNLSKWGGEVFCKVADKEIAEEAKRLGKTRSETAVYSLLNKNHDIGIIAVGNAPTALVEAVRNIEKSDFYKENPPLIIGVPVGFVNAEEAKDFLVEENNCYITSLGRKGGSSIAAAIINALLKLAQEE